MTLILIMVIYEIKHTDVYFLFIYFVSIIANRETFHTIERHSTIFFPLLYSAHSVFSNELNSQISKYQQRKHSDGAFT